MFFSPRLSLHQASGKLACADQRPDHRAPRPVISELGPMTETIIISEVVTYKVTDIGTEDGFRVFRLIPIVTI